MVHVKERFPYPHSIIHFPIIFAIVFCWIRQPAPEPIPTTKGRQSTYYWEDDFNNYSEMVSWTQGIHLQNGSATVQAVKSVIETDEHTVLMMHFDEGAGTTTSDSGPNGLSGNLDNMDANDWVPGVSGTALDFDGKNDHVQIQANTVLNVGPNITVEAWVKLRRDPGFSTMFVVHKREGYYMTHRTFAIDTPSVVYPAGRTPPIGNWTYMAGTYDGSDVKYYMDGKLIGSAPSDAGMHHQTQIFSIGASDGQNPFYAFDGLIDEVRVSDIARSESEINATYLRYQTGILIKMPPTSYLISKSVELPIDKYWQSLNVTKGCPSGTSINVTVIDDNTMLPIPGFENITAENISLMNLDSDKYWSIRLKAVFNSSSTQAAKLDHWGIYLVDMPELKVSITVPHNDQKVKGILLVRGTVTQMRGPVKIILNMGDKDSPSIFTTPHNGTWECAIQTKNYSDGPHEIRVEAYASGNRNDHLAYDYQNIIIDNKGTYIYMDPNFSMVMVIVLPIVATIVIVIIFVYLMKKK
jgi:hypothetical protein